MNSSASVVTTQEPRVSTPRLILVLTTIYTLLLVAVGCKMWATPGDNLFSIFVAFIPALIYAIAVFVYGDALFGNAGPVRYARAWSHLLWISALLHIAVFAVLAVISVATKPESLPEFWGGILAAGSVTALLSLWAQIGNTVFVYDRTLSDDERLAPGSKLGMSFLVGGAMMLSSLALEVGYSDTGWSIIKWEGRWVTLEFVGSQVFGPWLNGLTRAGYAAGIVLSLLSAIAGTIALAKKSIAQKTRDVVLSVSLVVFWFTLTNYYFACFYLVFVGIFNLTFPRMASAIVTMAWLTMFALGTVLWFKYRKPKDGRSKIRIAVVLWSLPLMPVTISTFWYAAGWELYGLVLYVAGLQIVTACWWKLAVPELSYRADDSQIVDQRSTHSDLERPDAIVLS